MIPSDFADGIILEKLETRQKYSEASATVNTSHRKKALVREPGNRPMLAGVVDVAELQTGKADIELLTPEGQRLVLPRTQVLAVYLVADYEMARATGAATAARQPGVWIRVRGRDRSTIDGILISELLDIQRGVWMMPLQEGDFYQRVYIPWESMAGLSVIEVVRPARRRRPGQRGRRDNTQIALFTETTADTQ